MEEYQGHRSKAAWNVSLWIGNDEWIYRRAVELVRKHKNIGAAARALLAELPPKTPDGFAYNMTNVKAALIGLE